jgi:hypothetical protein
MKTSSERTSVDSILHTCATLQEQGLWNTQRCCRECHMNPQTLCMGLDTYQWINGEQALLCSSAYWSFSGQSRI